MKNQNNPSEVNVNEIEQIKKEYQTPVFNEFGSMADLTAGGLNGLQDGDFTGTDPL